MKPDPSFPKLPAIGDLLKHPTVAQVVDRVNKTTIAQRATGFLEELQASLKKSADRIEVPSIHELAERLARRLLDSGSQDVPVINATGAIWGDHWPGPPLAEAAMHAMMRRASEYCEIGDVLAEQVGSLLIEMTGAEAVWVSGSLTGALELAGQVECEPDVAPYAGLIDPAEFGLMHVGTLRDSLTADVELVITSGAGLIGGPSCGIVLGRKESVNRLQEHPLAASLTADSLILAALQGTLEIYRSGDRVEHRIPGLQLLSTPLENLQQRCERLAPLLEASELIERTEPMRCEAIWLDTSANKLAGPTWAIKLKPASGSTKTISETLENAQPRVVARQQPQELWFDLRSVFPRSDQQLVASLAAAE